MSQSNKQKKSFSGGDEDEPLLSSCLSVLPPLLNCRAGRSLPVFLFPTPPQRSVLHAAVGQNFQLTATAQAHRSQ